MKNRILLSTFVLVNASFILFCSSKNKELDEASAPALLTTAVSDITKTTAISGGNITDDGGALVKARGICWSTNEAPTIEDNKTEDGTGGGSFTSNIARLEPGTTYYVRAYATNSVGTSYGNTVSFTTENQSNPNPHSDPDGPWTLQADFSDEFYGEALDLNKWNNNVESWGDWSWEPENTWVNDGVLEIRMKYSPHIRGGNQKYYTSGIIVNKPNPILYGYFEARIKAAPRFPGVCPAFWLYKIEEDIWTEIDIVELTQWPPDNPKRIHSALHVFKHPELESEIHEAKSWDAPWDPRDDYHIYGCEWDEYEIKWYVDGVLKRIHKNDYWHQPLDICVSFGLRPPLRDEPSSLDFPTTFQTDYVRVWKKNN